MEWAEYQHDDRMLFDSIGSQPEQWAWIFFELRAATDKPEWFPKGKWATIQHIEQHLDDQANRERKMT
jgi:hypothetical protein